MNLTAQIIPMLPAAVENGLGTAASIKNGVLKVDLDYSNVPEGGSVIEHPDYRAVVQDAEGLLFSVPALYNLDYRPLPDGGEAGAHPTYLTAAQDPATGEFYTFPISDAGTALVSDVTYPAGSVDNSWMDGKTVNIIKRATPKFLMPEMYIGQETQLVYCPADNPDDYTGATDFAPAFEAMHEEMLELLRPNGIYLLPTWKRAPFGVALQPGLRYVLDSGANFTCLQAKGLQIYGNGATLVGRYENGAPLIDMIGSHGITTNALNIESNNSAQPTFGVAIGRYQLGQEAGEMTFNNCKLDGWFKKATFMNTSAEVSRIIGGQVTSFRLNSPAIWIDSKNRVNMGASTQADDYTYGPNTDGSTISHWITGTSVYCASGSTDGAIKITSSETEGELNRIRGVYIDSYVQNSAINGLTRAPAIYVDGPVESLHARVHGEPGNADATLHLSHIVYYARGDGTNPLRQWDHRIDEYFSDAELSFIGCDSHANQMVLDGFQISVGYSRGAFSAVPAKLFGPNMTNVRFTGNVSTRTVPASFLNFDALEYCDASLVTSMDVGSAIHVKPSSRLDVKTTHSSQIGGQRLALKSVTANGTIDPAGYDVIYLSGAAVTSITLAATVDWIGEIRVTNAASNTVTVAGLQNSGGAVTLPSGRSVHVVQNSTLLFADIG